MAFAASLGWYGYRHYWGGRGEVTAVAPAPAAAAGPSAAPAPVSSPAEASSETGRTPPKPAAAPARSAEAPQAAPASKATVEKPVEKPATEAPAKRAGDAPATAAAPPAPGSPPAFDVVRVEPTGETVVAGRAAPGATVELMVDGRRHARVVADPSGLFALVPEPLSNGSHELVLQVPNGDGSRTVSTQTVTVVVAENRRDAPLVTVTAPGQPAVVLSRPDEPAKVAAANPPPVRPPAPAPAGSAGQGASANPPPRAAETPATPPSKTPSAPSPPRTVAAPAQADPPRPAQPPAPAKTRPSVQIASVEVEGAGRLLVSASAAPSATVRLYLNDSFIAPAAAGADGRVAFAIERGIQPGSYRVRLDDIDPVSGQVRSRAEVPFEMPTQLAGAGAPAASAPAPVRDPRRVAAASDEPVDAAAPEPRSMPDRAPEQRSASAAPPPASGQMPPPPAPPGPVVVIPAVSTTTVARGDSLWAISHRTYGSGWRYSVIYGANARQIRNPDLIYPGQIFVLPVPSRETAKH